MAGRAATKCKEVCDLKALNEAHMTPCAGCAGSGPCLLKDELARRRGKVQARQEAQARDAGDEPAEVEAPAEAAVHRVTKEDIMKLPEHAAERLLQQPNGPRLLEVTPEQLVAPTRAGEMLRQALVLCGRWCHVIVDEAHCGRQRDAARYRAAYEQLRPTLAELKAQHEASRRPNSTASRLPPPPHGTAPVAGGGRWQLRRHWRGAALGAAAAGGRALSGRCTASVSSS